MKGQNDRIAILDPRRELPSMVRYMTADRLAGVIEQAQNGDTRELFALYRDIVVNDSQVRAEFMKRKIAALGDPVSVVPFGKGEAADVDAARRRVPPGVCEECAAHGLLVHGAFHGRGDETVRLRGCRS